MRGANDLFLFALGEDDAFGHPPHTLDNALHGAGDRVSARRQLRLVGLHIDDRPSGNARSHRSFRDRNRHDMDETGIEGYGNDVVSPKPRPRAAICDGDVVRHIFPCKVRERVRGGDLHLHVDSLCPHIEGARKI